MEENEKYEKQQAKYKWIFATITICCIAIVITATATYYFTTQKIVESGLKIVTSDSSSDDSIIDTIAATLKNFKTVIDAYYIGDIDEENLINETVKGFVNGLGDKYSEYYTADEWEEFEETALGNYRGIGVYMSQDENDNIVIASVIKESPAEEVGLKSEDIIVAINDEDFIGKTPSEAASTIKGSDADTVNLKIYRTSESKYIDFEIELREVKIYHVETEMLDNNIGYISLVTFDTGCAEELRTALTNLKNDGAQKFILDLRYNTGGLVNEAIDIASAFLEEGSTVLYTVDSTGNELETKTDLESIDTTSDMVVLVNYYSASASEILTGALKDHGRATVVGEKTYGKGVIQNVFPLIDGSKLKLTYAEYYTPNKTKINQEGIEPDYEVEITDEDVANLVDSQLEKAKEILNSKQ